MLPPGKELVIYDDRTPAAARRFPPQWAIVHNNAHHAPPADHILDFTFDRDFDFYGLSGYSWYIYRNRR